MQNQWNRPLVKPNTKGRTSCRPSAKYRFLLLVGLPVVILSVVIYLWVGRENVVSDESEPKAAPAKKAVKTVSPRTNRVAKAEEEKPLYATKFWELDASKTNGFTEGMMRKWQIAHRPRPKEMPKATYKKDKYAIFNHPSENAIAGLLVHEPGKGMIGTPVYGPAFERDFLASCEEPIIVDDKDDDYSRELKRMMNETKIDLRQRMADGESLSQILLDAHKELQKLGQVRRDIENGLREMVKETAQTEQDVDDLFAAANKLLESKGIAPMKSNTLLKMSLMHSIKNKKSK